MGTLGSTPTVALIGTNQYVVWEGTEGHLWLAYWTGSWHGPYNLGMGQLGSRPSISVNQSNSLTVGWKGNDGNLWYAVSPQNPSASGWSGPYSLGLGPLGSSPSVTGAAGGQYLNAAWTGTAPQNDMWWHQGNGTFMNMGMGPLDSPPSVVELPLENWQGVWAGTDGNLWQAQWHYTINGGTSLLDWGRLGYGPLGGAPSIGFDTNTFFVVWQGTDNGLWEETCNLAFSGCGTLTEVPGMGPL
jgi:hypothetical protein